ncbi:MAG: hypothetical protein IJS80_04160, partial [Lachnospiraceae bacterium]|nr:hypothetical protein [Lachnospiraceae bacterium]
MNKKIRGLISITLTISLLLLNGCGSDKESENVSVKEPVKKEQSDSVTKETDNGEETDTVDSAVSEKDAGEKKKDLSLAERMCGKYSYHSGGSDGNEFFTLDVISFGNNLYAMGGEAMGDDSDSLEPYSFWAMEFIPNNKEDLKSTTSLKADVNILEFSIMSNQSQYFNTRAQDGSVELTADGLVFNGFDGSG